MADYLKRYIHEDGQFKVTIVNTTGVGRQLFQKLNPSPGVLQLVNDAGVGAMLLAAGLKDQGIINIKFDGTGPLSQITAEANTLGHIRATANQPDLVLGGEGALFTRALGKQGNMVVSRRTAASDQAITAVDLDRKPTPIDHLILATPPWISQTLLKPHAPALAAQLAALRHHPICTIYLRYPPDVVLGPDMIGMVDSLSQWVFDRGVAGQPGLMAIIISGPGAHMAMTNADVARQITAELAQLNPRWPAPVDWKIIREKRATFACHANVHTLRPGPESPLRNVWLAGDYVDTGYPATLEGAVRSGLASARGVAKGIKQATHKRNAAPDHPESS